MINEILLWLLVVCMVAVAIVLLAGAIGACFFVYRFIQDELRNRKG